LKQVKIEDEAAVARMFNSLMGSAVGPRKSFIEDNAYKANVII
jgi:DNA gyrase subunit B